MVCKAIDCCVKQRYGMGLTVKQNEFVAEIAEGASQTSAYRSAYNTQNMSQKTIWEEASRLRSHPPDRHGSKSTPSGAGLSTLGAADPQPLATQTSAPHARHPPNHPDQVSSSTPLRTIISYRAEPDGIRAHLHTAIQNKGSPARRSGMDGSLGQAVGENRLR